MKNILGGVEAPPGGNGACATGQTLHYCLSTMSNGAHVGGDVCADSIDDAENFQIITWNNQGTWGGEGFILVQCT